MEKEESLLLWFEEIEREDVAIVGGKASSLGELTAKTAVPVPYGFTTTAHAYRYFMEKSGLNDKINELLRFLYFFRSNTCLFHVAASPAYKRKSMFWPTIFSCGVIT